MNGMWRPGRWAAGGFTLVEVTLALGIVAFCLVGLVGMFSFGLGSSRQSNDDTVLASAAAQLVSQVRSVPTFDKAASGTPYIQGTHYFDVRGQEVTQSSTAALYVCRLTGDYVPASELPSIVPDPTNPTQTSLTRLTLAFSMPATVPASQRVSSTVFYASIPSR